MGRKSKMKKNKNGKKNNNNNGESSESLSSFDIDELLRRKIEILYKVALEKMVRKFGFKRCEATRAVLLNGSVLGEETNILNNILKNSLEAAHHKDDSHEPIFQDISEFAKYSMQTLINMIVQHPSKPSKKYAILFLLQSEFLSRDHTDDEKDDEDVDVVGNNDKEKQPHGCFDKDLGIHLGKMLKVQMNTTALHRRSDNNSISNLPPNLTDESNFKDWLIRVCGKDERREIARKLVEEVEKLEIEVKEKKEWAIKTVLNAAKKVNDSGLLLQELRYQGNILKKKKKEKEEEEELSRSTYSKRQNFLMKAKCEIRERNKVKREMEDMNMKYKSEISSNDLNYLKTQKSIIEAKKKERKMVEKCKDGEKIIEELKRKMKEEKNKIEEMGMREKELNQKNDAILLKLKQAKEEKEQAYAKLVEEKRLYKVVKDNSKDRLATVRQEIDMKFRQSIEDEKRLELELSELIKNQSNSTASSSSAIIKAKDESKYKYQRSKVCMICSESDVNIVFLPCAHQVICSNCKDNVYFALEDFCPCCDSFIQEAVQVFDPSD